MPAYMTNALRKYTAQTGSAISNWNIPMSVSVDFEAYRKVDVEPIGVEQSIKLVEPVYSYYSSSTTPDHEISLCGNQYALLLMDRIFEERYGLIAEDCEQYVIGAELLTEILAMVAQEIEAGKFEDTTDQEAAVVMHQRLTELQAKVDQSTHVILYGVCI